MTSQEARQRNVEYLLSGAEDCLESARSELSAGRCRFAMNRVYYACFYAASAVLLSENRHYVSHAGVRAAVHQHLVKPGRISTELGKFFDQAFQDRQTADYGAFAEFDPDTAKVGIESAQQFLDEIKRLLGS